MHGGASVSRHDYSYEAEYTCFECSDVVISKKVMPEHTIDVVFEMQWGFFGSYYNDHTTRYDPLHATLRTSTSAGIFGSLRILAFQNIQIL